MPVIPFNELDKFIATTSFEVGHESMNMLSHFRDKRTSRERVVENVTRKLIEAMDTIEESYNYGSKEEGLFLEE
jgi:hypothetical protein